MKSPSPSQLVAALADEYAALLDFVALLEREQAMLVENPTDQLLELSRQKTSDALKLERFAETRRDLLQNSISPAGIASAPNVTRTGNLPPDPPGMDTIQAWLKINSPEGLAIWLKLRDLATRAQQLNDNNGLLIQMKLRHNQQSLAVLSSAAKKANLYGPDGQHSFSPGSGRSLGSG